MSNEKATPPWMKSTPATQSADKGAPALKPVANAVSVLVGSEPLTMSSREIAEVVAARHDNVKVSIERLAERGVIALPAMQEYPDSLGRPAKEYRLDKRSSLIVVAQLCPEFTAHIVDRWQELEAQVKMQNQTPASVPVQERGFEIPKTLSEALLLAGKLAKKNEQQTVQITELTAEDIRKQKIIESQEKVIKAQAKGVMNKPLTVREFAALSNIYISRLDAGLLGRKASAICRARGITISKRQVMWKGTVSSNNEYPFEILEDAYNTFFAPSKLN